jgi:hypothetical protein
MEPRLSIITLGVSKLECSYHFYPQGLGFPTSRKLGDDIIFIHTSVVFSSLSS